MNVIKLAAATSIVPISLLIMQAPAAAQDVPAQNVPEGAASPPVPGSTPPAASPATVPSTPPNPRVVAFVDQQFPVADANRDGTLTAPEFTAWVSALKTAERQKAGLPDDPDAVKVYTDAALYTADGDKDKILTKTELANFFSR